MPTSGCAIWPGRRRGAVDARAVALPSLPEGLRQAQGVAAVIAPESLRDGVFADGEGRLLEQAVWCRDIAQWARGDAAVRPRRRGHPVRLDGSEHPARPAPARLR